ncbi:DUF2185 domain-containing protein [Flexivirga caeni]|uniref:DUF2185 domain-containing protein n=1 Tax=Flexivirga caeni TaxID=2294115 RepID=A0A3M9MH55_9MICO|nr:DUF2185 domain-containing protein [Flexivirga caeni]
MEFIPDAGACLVTTHVRDGVGRVKFMVREKSQVPADNGWRIFSEFDTEEYMNQGDPFVIMAFNDVCAIEPALIGIYDFPVGSDLAIEREGGIRIIDVTSGREIPVENFYVPPQFRA